MRCRNRHCVCPAGAAAIPDPAPGTALRARLLMAFIAAVTADDALAREQYAVILGRPPAGRGF